MNTREFVKIGEDEQNIVFNEIDKEDELLFRKYMEASRHFQEIFQLYKMMLFNLEELLEHYDMQFDDRVYSKHGEKVDAIEINALVSNAVSSARTLIESMDVFDKVYIDKEENFKKNYISKAYDEDFSYRFIDFIRNYMQHGHVPVSFDGEKISFQLSEILDTAHTKINATLKKQMKNIEQQLFDYGEMNVQLTVVKMLYKYFLLVHILICEFLKYIKKFFLEITNKINNILDDHPEYVLHIYGTPFVVVYLDTGGNMNGFDPRSDILRDIDSKINFAEEKLKKYEQSNGHLFFLRINYCLENRFPVTGIIDDDMLPQNLEEVCLKIGTGIYHLSFDTYYGDMEMNAVYRLYPYIQFEDGIHWNVPYQNVTIEDFVRTFPLVKRDGLVVFANNVGGADEFLQRIMQDWSAYLWEAKIILSKAGISSPIDIIDWASRFAFVLQGVQWLKKSFAKQKKDKPCIKDLRNYILKNNSWNINELQKNLHARRELLVIVLEELGYVCRNDSIYIYDSDIAELIEQERNELCQKRYDNHGTNVNCYNMNLSVEQLNVDLMYLAVLVKEAGKLDTYDSKVQDLIQSLKDYNQYIVWDDLSKAIRFEEQLPENFSMDDADCICRCVEHVDESVNAEIRRLEDNNN